MASPFHSFVTTATEQARLWMTKKKLQKSERLYMWMTSCEPMAAPSRVGALFCSVASNSPFYFFATTVASQQRGSGIVAKLVGIQHGDRSVSGLLKTPAFNMHRASWPPQLWKRCHTGVEFITTPPSSLIMRIFSNVRQCRMHAYDLHCSGDVDTKE